jgi:hypothetical protein
MSNRILLLVMVSILTFSLPVLAVFTEPDLSGLASKSTRMSFSWKTSKKVPYLR